MVVMFYVFIGDYILRYVVNVDMEDFSFLFLLQNWQHIGRISVVKENPDEKGEIFSSALLFENW